MGQSQTHAQTIHHPNDLLAQKPLDIKIKLDYTFDIKIDMKELLSNIHIEPFKGHQVPQ